MKQKRCFFKSSVFLTFTLWTLVPRSLSCRPLSLQHSVEVTWLVQEVWFCLQTGQSGTARERTVAGGYMSGRTNGCYLMYNCEKSTNTQTHKHHNVCSYPQFGPTENQMLSLKMHARSSECGGSVKDPAPCLLIFLYSRSYWTIQFKTWQH